MAGYCLVGRVAVARPVFEYVHAIEGRLRIKVPEVKRSPAVARRVEGQFRAIDGILEVSANPVTGNVLFHFEPDQIEPYAIMGTLVTLGYMKEIALDRPIAGPGAGALPARLADHAGSTLAQRLVRLALRFLGTLAPQHDLIERLVVTVTERVMKALFRQVTVGLTSTETGLKVGCELDRNSYPSGIKVTKQDMEGIKLRKDTFHGEWNYTILPQPRK